MKLLAPCQMRNGHGNAKTAAQVTEHGEQRGCLAAFFLRDVHERQRADGDEQERQSQHLEKPHDHEMPVIRLRREVRRYKHAKTTQQQSDDGEIARRESRHQLPHHRHQHKHDQGTWREHQPGQRCVIAEMRLQQQRQQRTATVEHKARNKNQHAGHAELPVFHEMEVDQRIVMRPQAMDGAHQAHHAGECHGEDQVAVEPVLLLAFIQHDLQRTQTYADQPQPPIINRHDAFCFRVGRVFHQARHHDEGEDTDGNVDVKNPPPVIIIRDEAAERGAQDRRHDHRNAGDGEHRAASLRREGIQDNRLLRGLQSAARRTLHQPKDNERGERRRGAAKERRHRKPADTSEEKILAAHHPRQPAGKR